LGGGPPTALTECGHDEFERLAQLFGGLHPAEQQGVSTERRRHLKQAVGLRELCHE